MLLKRSDERNILSRSSSHNVSVIELKHPCNNHATASEDIKGTGHESLFSVIAPSRMYCKGDTDDENAKKEADKNFLGVRKRKLQVQLFPDFPELNFSGS